MTKIRLLTSVAGGAVEGAEGDVVDAPEEIAAAWCESGQAELVEERKRHKQTEKAVKAAPENRTN